MKASPKLHQARVPMSARTRRRSAQRGSVAVEFALIFPVFFLILYAIVTFSLIFVAQQNMTLAAEEGARAALNWASNTSMASALTNRGANACAAANQAAASILQNIMQCTQTATSCGPGNAMYCINVSLSYDYKNNPFVPTLGLMTAPLPNSLVATATVQLNPENIQ